MRERQRVRVLSRAHIILQYTNQRLDTEFEHAQLELHMALLGVVNRCDKKIVAVSSVLMYSTISCMLRPGLGHTRARRSIRRNLIYGGVANGWSSSSCRNGWLVRSEMQLASYLYYRSLAKLSIQALVKRLSLQLGFSRSTGVSKAAAVLSDGRFRQIRI